MFKADVSGYEEIAEKLRAAASQIADPLRSAANAGATVMKGEVAMRAPRKSGVLQDNIYQKHQKERSNDTQQSYVVSWRKKDKDEDPFYGAWVEYGHWYVPRQPDGVSRKAHRAANRKVFVPAQPFLRPGFAAGKDPALVAMKSRLAQRLDEVFKELAR